MHPGQLTDTEIESRLIVLNDKTPEGGWCVLNGRLHRQFVFASFVEAVAFMTKVAVAAEVMDHYPLWSNFCQTVTVNLVTHDVGGLTERDFSLARRMVKLAFGQLGCVEPKNT